MDEMTDGKKVRYSAWKKVATKDDCLAATKKTVVSSAQKKAKTKGKCSVQTTAVRRLMVESSAHKPLKASGFPTAGKMVVKLVVSSVQKKVDC